MKRSLQILLSTAASACLCSLTAHSQTVTGTYDGNGATGFGGPIGQGVLTLSSDGTTLSGNIVPGNNQGTNQIYDELVIYIDTGASGGITTTANLTAASGSVNQYAAAGENGTTLNNGQTHAVVNFNPGFAANYALVLSPDNGQAGSLFSFNADGTLNLLADANLSPVGGTTVGPYTFSLPLSDLGSVTAFDFTTTYLNGHGGSPSIYRSNETFANTLVDTQTPGTTGNPADDTVTVGVDTFNGGINLVPEPSTWAMMLVGVLALVGFHFRRSRI